MNFTRIFSISCIAAMLISLGACNKADESRIKTLEAERDSLAGMYHNVSTRYDELSSYLNEVSECIDSVTEQEKLLFVDKDPETGRRYSRVEIKKRIKEMGDLIERQRTRIAAITDSLNGKSSVEVERLSQLVVYLNEQLATKELQLQKLQNELDASRKDITELKSTITSVQANNDMLQSENALLDQMVAEKTTQLHQGWLLAKTKKELSDMGILTGGNIIKKAKFDPGAIRTSDCVALDTRTFTEVSLNSKKKPVLLSQAPTSSYVFEDIGGGKWKLIITDTMSFWSLSKFIVIQLQ